MDENESPKGSGEGGCMYMCKYVDPVSSILVSEVLTHSIRFRWTS